MAKVMLVEDDPTMVSLLRTFLEIEGFEVATFSPGEDILRSIQKSKPDIILLDVHLKNIGEVEIDGFELLAQIKEDNQLNGAKVIMSSGMDFQDKSVKYGADGFILKPFMPNDMIQLFKKVLG